MFSFLKGSQKQDEPASPPKARMLLIIGGALLGILLLLFGGGIAAEEEQESAPSPQEILSQDELLVYQAHLEERVRLICESVRGVGRVSAIVSLESGFESIYATEYKDNDETYVILGSGSSASALLLGKAAPTVCGIGVVCEGGDNPIIQNELISLLSATFHISSNRIYVTGSGSS